MNRDLFPNEKFRTPTIRTFKRRGSARNVKDAFNRVENVIGIVRSNPEVLVGTMVGKDIFEALRLCDAKYWNIPLGRTGTDAIIKVGTLCRACLRPDVEENSKINLLKGLFTYFWPRPYKLKMKTKYPVLYLPRTSEDIKNKRSWTIDEGWNWANENQIYFILVYSNAQGEPSIFWMSKYVDIPKEYWNLRLRKRGGTKSTITFTKEVFHKFANFTPVGVKCKNISQRIKETINKI